MKKIITKILNPNTLLGLLICLFSSVLLIYVFSMHLEGTMTSYIAYFLSSYSLVIFMVWFCKVCKFSSDFIKRTKLYNIYMQYYTTIIKYLLIISSIFNFIYGIFKLGTGIIYKSWWFITFAIYYLVLWFMKISLVIEVKHFGNDINNEYKKLRNTGLALFMLDIVLVGMIMLIIKQNQVLTYPGYLIYIMALYDFYLITIAFMNVFRHRKIESPAIYASKCISLTVAMISMLSLEVAMIYKFGNNDTNFRIIMISCTGFGIAIVNFVMALIMIYKSKKKQ